MQRFYLPATFTPDETLKFSRDESHHIVRVMRLTVDDELSLVNGKGDIAVGVLSDADAKGCSVRVKSVGRVENTNRIHLCFAIPKGPALEFIFRRCTELGIASFQPLITQHSLHGEWNPERWQRVVTEVGKQCQEPHFPILRSPLKLRDWLNQRETRPLFFCSEKHRDPKKTLEKNGSYDLLVGCEGGWSESEIAEVLSTSAHLLGLGNNRLRAETAALVSTIILKIETGELQQ